MTLHAVLQAHRAQLGERFENLGAKSGLYLSYEADKGWSVIQLSPLQQLIRAFLSICGCYASTHLKTIAARLPQEGDIPADLNRKIAASFRKAYPQEQLPGRPPEVPAARPQQNQAVEAPAPGAAAVARYSVRIGRTECVIEAGDITEQGDVDAIVNAANSELQARGGVDGAIHRAAGPRLQAALNALNAAPLETGKAVVTEAFDLPRPIQRIVHTVGPIYEDHEPEEAADLLESCVMNSLERIAVIEEPEMRRIAFPAISTGAYGYPLEGAITVMFAAIGNYAHETPNAFDLIKIVVPPRAFEAAKAAAMQIQIDPAGADEIERA